MPPAAPTTPLAKLLPAQDRIAVAMRSSGTRRWKSAIVHRRPAANLPPLRATALLERFPLGRLRFLARLRLERLRLGRLRHDLAQLERRHGLRGPRQRAFLDAGRESGGGAVAVAVVQDLRHQLHAVLLGPAGAQG